MRSPCLQLLTSRTLNDYTLPPGWLPIACINPDDSDYEVQTLDKALLSRFVKVQVVADIENWLAWGETNGVEKAVLNYVASDKKIFKDTCPRDWKYVSDMRLAHAKDQPLLAPEILDIAIAGLVGRERMVGFKTFMKGGKALPNILDILGSYRMYRDTIRECVRKGETDKLDSLVFALKIHLQHEDNYHQLKDSNKWRALGEFVRDLIPDLAEDLLDFLESKGYAKPNE